MSLMDQIKAKAKADKKTHSVARRHGGTHGPAAAKIVAEGLADVTLLGKPEAIAEVAARFSVDLAGVTLLDPEASPDLPRYIEEFYELRKEKGVTPGKGRGHDPQPALLRRHDDQRRQGRRHGRRRHQHDG